MKQHIKNPQNYMKVLGTYIVVHKYIYTEYLGTYILSLLTILKLKIAEHYEF